MVLFGANFVGGRTHGVPVFDPVLTDSRDIYASLRIASGRVWLPAVFPEVKAPILPLHPYYKAFILLLVVGSFD